MITNLRDGCVLVELAGNMAERQQGESNLDKKLMWGGVIGALVAAGFGVGILVQISLLAAGTGGGMYLVKERFGKKQKQT